MVIRDGQRVRSVILDDPRLSKAQVQAITKLAYADRQATLEGLDAKMRPVVKAKVGGARSRVETALMRNGDPAKPLMPFAERWATPGRS